MAFHIMNPIHSKGPMVTCIEKDQVTQIISKSTKFACCEFAAIPNSLGLGGHNSCDVVAPYNARE